MAVPPSKELVVMKPFAVSAPEHEFVKEYSAGFA
jgi:hypothetical protein